MPAGAGPPLDEPPELDPPELDDEDDEESSQATAASRTARQGATRRAFRMGVSMTTDTPRTHANVRFGSVTRRGDNRGSHGKSCGIGHFRAPLTLKFDVAAQPRTITFSLPASAKVTVHCSTEPPL